MKSSFVCRNVTNRQQSQNTNYPTKEKTKSLIIKIEPIINNYIKAVYETMERNTIRYSLYFSNLTKPLTITSIGATEGVWQQKETQYNHQVYLSALFRFIAKQVKLRTNNS
jgi:hypothetical protein